MSGLIAITTDFGSRDWYAGTMKGVILGINPRAVIVDLTHGIAPGDIPGAALALKSSHGFFPPGTVHLIVVDPGVGSERRILALGYGGQVFVAPDNGVLSMALGEAALAAARSVERAEFRLKRISGTFHGRDILAPAAAHISLGVAIEELGPPCPDCVSRSLPSPRSLPGNALEAEVIYQDIFGNLITNIPEQALRHEPERDISIEILGRTIDGMSRSYSSVNRGELLALRGSSGYMEISVNGGSAAKRLGLGDATRAAVVVRPR